jgi:hypothetical protein
VARARIPQLVESLSRGVGDAHAIMFEEMDSLITWIANPGKSGGSCGRGMAKIGFFDPRLALELVKNRNFSVG